MNIKIYKRLKMKNRQPLDVAVKIKRKNKDTTITEQHYFLIRLLDKKLILRKPHNIEKASHKWGFVFKDDKFC